ncbi:MJ0042 family finger-like domain-containing protein [Roseovarius litoreus]|uniref:MJ0042 family finger-like domain-containing protein n=1 Tax=Roseovarius litoreus TaxID=1155722 RepID=A0A1M7AVK4_9RHOB|nr:zinc-ribbon domain-containing protein [Roseovarius litoreus]SHL46744.1 MJ0042 family finger-like domain-containing protein [Roseovarius litoreus]
MRLTCPNCGAQYEVPDEVIPETGRDVQCSNCGDTWFQFHPDHMPQDDAQAETGAEPQSADADDGYAEYDVEPDPEPDPQPDPTPEDHYDDPDEDAEEEEDTAPPRRELDPSIRDLLREEAAREEQARAAEAGPGLETQPDLGLDEAPDTLAQNARARIARLRGLPVDTDEPATNQDIDPESRRNLLPDIEEINSSLDAAPQRDVSASRDDDAMAAPSAGGGFRRGFVWSIVLFAILTLLYVFAPQVAGLSSALEGPMAAYVEMVNSLRALLQSTVASFLR